MPAWWQTYAQCPLMNLESDLAKLRIIAELINFVGAILYLLVALREARFLGYKMFIENLVRLMYTNQNVRKNEIR